MASINATRNGIRQAWLRIPERVRRPLLVVVGLAALVALPFVVKAVETSAGLSLLFSLNVALLYVMLALGLNIVVGFAGLLDLGYAAFFALGAYSFGVLTAPFIGLEWSFWICVLVAAPIAAVFGLIIGTPTLRLRGDYLAIVTLAFGEIVPNALRNLYDINIPWLGIDHFNLTNGTQGLNPVGKPVIDLTWIFPNMVPFTVGQHSNQIHWYFLVIAAVFLVLFSSRRLDDSRLGRAWKAIREDETAAACMGVNPVRSKLLAFALGASFSGIAGAIFASLSQAVFPELFRFNVSIFILIIVIISGMGNVWGVLAGGLLITLFDRILLAQIAPPFLHNLAARTGWDFLNIDIQLYRWVLFGVGLLIIMLLRPEGLFPSRVRRAELHEAEEEAEAGSEPSKPTGASSEQTTRERVARVESGDDD
jgi:branched-chain amino acid transport system permease protein